MKTKSRVFGLLTLLAVFLILFVSCASTGDSSVKYKAGTYEAAAPGMHGDVIVSVTVNSNSIVKVGIVSQSETKGIADAALEKIPAAIVKAGSVDVDSVAGASVTSAAIKAAVKKALEKAQGIVDEKKDIPLAFMNPDVIVIGAGSAGINAAIEAADRGAKVYLIEKNGDIGGSGRYAGGTLSGAGTKMQKAAGIEDTPEKFMADIKSMGGGLNIPELTKKHVDNSAAAVDWMDSLGADFGDRIPTQPATYDAFGTPREHRVKGNGVAILETIKPLLYKHIKNGKIVLLLNTRVQDIIIESGAVTGVVIADAAKTTYKAASIILATGGYGHNEEWIHRYNFKNVLTDSPDFVTGDGYVFAEKAGAVFSNMSYLPAYAGGVPVSDSGFKHTVTALNTKYPGVIWVAKDGERFIDEFGCTDGKKKQAWATASENIVYMILTQKMKESQTPLFVVNNKPDQNWARFDAEAVKGEVVLKADSLEALAKAAGIDGEALKATVKAYNASCASGKDEEFGRTGSLIPLTEGPFYAVKTVPYVMLTKGGPKMNPLAQVLDAKDKPIPGLFECGELAGGANIGGGASIGGLANTSCIVWGKIAGESAAQYALKK